MIICCPNCNKQFKINLSLIPDNGRDLKCGSCDHLWFYKIEDNKIEFEIIEPKIRKVVKKSYADNFLK